MPLKKGAAKAHHWTTLANAKQHDRASGLLVGLHHAFFDQRHLRRIDLPLRQGHVEEFRLVDLGKLQLSPRPSRHSMVKVLLRMVLGSQSPSKAHVWTILLPF